MNTLNLARDPWIPVARADGTRALIAPWQLPDSLNPVLAIDSTRAPWNAALTEFLISFLQTIILPEDARVWRELWNDPPSTDYLRRETEKVAPLFDLQGSVPFMQDPSLLADPSNQDKYWKPVQKLPVDGVSEEQEKKHSDLFAKSGSVMALCLPCAAAALWDLQAHSPQGSAGYYTSLRGGHPSTTLISTNDLWHTVWANVLEQSCFGMKGRPDPASFLPWLKPAQRKVDPKKENPLHVLWGMPRRVLLKIDAGEADCDTCGAHVTACVRGFYSYRGGFQYAQQEWTHPCSPYISREDLGFVARAADGDLVGYRNWVGLLVDTPSGDGVPALVVRRWLERDVPKEPYLRVWAYGYKTDQASVSRWCEGKMPLLMLENGHRKEYERFVITLVTLSERGAECLSAAIHGAFKASGAGKHSTREAQADLWRSTEAAFLENLRAAAAGPSKATFDEIADRWMEHIQRTALAIYEKHLPDSRISPMWVARYAHRLRRRLSSRDPVTLKTYRFGDWRLTDA